MEICCTIRQGEESVSGLRLVGLTKSFEDFKAVDDITLDVEEGEFVTLLGPSGCGKTTTLRTIAGFLTPDSGEVYIKGRLVNHIPPNRRNTGMCFQSYALFPHMTVYDNVRFGLRMRSVPLHEQKKRVLEALQLVELEQLAARRPSELSGGQQQRVALARAIVIEPDVLLFDEPLSNLDAKLRESVRVEIRSLQKRLGITSIYVTHDQAEALVISDRVVVMNRGRIEQVGDPLTVYDRPNSSFVAGFIGLANIFKGTVVRNEGDCCRVRAEIGEVLIRSEGLLPGRALLFSFRPEDAVQFHEPSRNRIRGTIRHSIFMGNLTDLFIDVGSVVVRAQMSKGGSYREGEAIELSVPEDAFRILDREAVP
jgi:ABC-type Fe3+/spermidine/putrescine transport system ATPase subunit